MKTIAAVSTWVLGSCVSAELVGYWLHRLLHSGAVGFLSRGHMKHHLLLYGPLQEQRSKKYYDATTRASWLGNIGMEWLIPAAVLMVGAAVVFHLGHIGVRYQLIYFATTLAWSFLVFSYLHDVMHIEGFWMETNRLLKRWFVSARQRHEDHHTIISDVGLMNKNFGIGFFFFDRLFGTLSEGETEFNQDGYGVAQERFKSVLHFNP